MNNIIAKIAVDKTIYSFDKLFSYVVPKDLADKIVAGVRVIVPFGRGNKKQQGVVFEVIEDDTISSDLKSIVSVLDEKPIFTEDLLSVAKYMVTNTFCTYYDAIHTILPNGYNYKIVPKYALSKPLDEIDFSQLNENQKKLILFLKTVHTASEINDFFTDLSQSAQNKLLDELIEKGYIYVLEEALRRVSDKTIRMIRLSDEFEQIDLKLTQKQKSIISLLQQTGVASIKETCYFCSVTEAVIKNLEKKGIISYFDREVFRTPRKAKSSSTKDIVLSDEQKSVFDGIISLYNTHQPNVALLNGVTGSGKTSVFIKLIESVIDDGKQVIMLVPEISLTPQTLSNFQNVFGKNVAVLHSSLSMGEQLDEWKRISNGDVNIVVGTRSAVFAPFKNLGLIIMDEEGEFSYKSDKTPRYHARDIAKVRCVNNNCLLLLASATPQIDSYYYAKTGKYKLFHLNNRYNNASLPYVEVVDLRQDPTKGANGISERLLEELCANLERKEQSILLLNRRGYNTHAQCVNCGEVISCPNCSVAMTYHKANNMLMCHYCGRSIPLPKSCPSCESEYLRLSGLGTQKLEEELSILLPNARIVRMDTDTTYSKYAFEEKFERFRNGEYDIMLGTQMIAKGHDFPNVTLTGVILADQTLYSGDFKCGEKTFSLLTQVVGRSGRGEKIGRAIIQTYSPEEPVIAFASEQNYQGFYNDEIEARKAMLYPPFCDLCMFGISGISEQQVIVASQLLSNIIINTAKQESFNEPLRVLGPTQANIYRINNKYRYRLILKCNLNSKTKKFIRFILNGINKLPEFENISVYADINGDIN